MGTEANQETYKFKSKTILVFIECRIFNEFMSRNVPKTKTTFQANKYE